MATKISLRLIFRKTQGKLKNPYADTFREHPYRNPEDQSHRPFYFLYSACFDRSGGYGYHPDTGFPSNQFIYRLPVRICRSVP